MTEHRVPRSKLIPKASRVQDIPQFKEMDGIFALIKVARFTGPFIRPILKLMGKNLEGFDQTMTKLIDMESQAAGLTTIPDRFNTAFSGCGWIMYEYMNVEIAKAAVVKAEAGDVSGAEEDLVAHYTTETVQWNLMTMGAIAAFAPRMALAQKALTDYTEGRYYASTMVTLALLDGLVSELHEKRRGFFATETEIEAVDSISGHSTGLQELSTLLSKTRKTTRHEPIDIPYRHGIMHGMDLGFDNKQVAAKSWAALFAIRDWALRAEAGTLNLPKKQPDKKPLGEKLREYAENQKRHDALQKSLDEWKPRTITFDPTSSSNDFLEEQKLVEFLGYWKRRNYGKMAECFPRSHLVNKSLPKTAKEIRRTYSDKKLIAYSLVAMRDVSAAITEIDAQLSLDTSDGIVDRSMTLRMAFEDANGDLTARGTDGGRWVVNTWP